MTVCIAVNGEKIYYHAVTLTLVRKCPKSNLPELFSYTTIYLNLIFQGFFLFEFSCKNTHRNMETGKHTTHTHTHTHTHTDAYTDFDEYSIVVFCKKATIIFIIDKLTQ